MDEKNRIDSPISVTKAKGFVSLEAGSLPYRSKSTHHRKKNLFVDQVQDFRLYRPSVFRTNGQQVPAEDFADLP